MPPAIISFLESDSYEDAIRNAIYLGGDSDTLACMTGGIAEAYYKEIPEGIVAQVMKRLPESFVSIINEFSEKYIHI